MKSTQEANKPIFQFCILLTEIKCKKNQKEPNNNFSLLSRAYADTGKIVKRKFIVNHLLKDCSFDTDNSLSCGKCYRLLFILSATRMGKSNSGLFQIYS